MAFNRATFQVMHVLGKTLKYAAIGGVVAAAVTGIVPLLIGGGAGSFISMVAAGLGFSGFASTAASYTVAGLMAALTPGLIAGGIGGAAIGLASGITGAGAAADEKEETQIDAERSQLASQQRTEALKISMAQKRMQLEQMERQLGIVPTHGLGQGIGGAGERSVG